MRRRMMKSKIHRATVTDANLNYVGSITIDTELMAAADLLEWEQVAIVDIDNGNRFETYVIPGAPGSGAMCLNGAAARLVHPGDRIIVLSYADYDSSELEGGFEPSVVHVDRANRVIPEELAQLQVQVDA
ncbi:MAG TPA: aspartate 1-decarboxylase [Acidimicrobiales bacterium]|nr:aspartate 1-decarboxylase [Acidimicrobiales bacterium]